MEAPHIHTRRVPYSQTQYDYVNKQQQQSNESSNSTLTTQYGLIGHPGAANFTFLSHGLAPKLRARARSYIVDNVINIPFPSGVHFGRGSPEYAHHVKGAAGPLAAGLSPAEPAPNLPLVLPADTAGGSSSQQDWDQAAMPGQNQGASDNNTLNAEAAPALRVGPAFDSAEVAASKRLLVSMAFATRKPFRRQLRNHCKARPVQCGFLDVQTGQVAVDRKGHVQDAASHLQELVRELVAGRKVVDRSSMKQGSGAEPREFLSVTPAAELVLVATY